MGWACGLVLDIWVFGFFGFGCLICFVLGYCLVRGVGISDLWA